MERDRDAARSVHLWWSFPFEECSWITNEVVVESSEPNTYFCVIGWSRGYCGIQQRENDKILIFSVWDDCDDRPEDVADAVDMSRRCQCLDRGGPHVEEGRFGNEGTGCRIRMPLAWTNETTYRFALRETPYVSPEGISFLQYRLWMTSEASSDKWVMVASIAAPTRHARRPNGALTGVYSFVEDYGRRSVRKTLRARFGPCSAAPKSLPAQHSPLVMLQGVTAISAKFTAASEPSNAIDSGLSHDNRWFLSTGGSTKATRELNSNVDRHPMGMVAGKMRHDLPWHPIATAVRSFTPQQGQAGVAVIQGRKYAVTHMHPSGWWEIIDITTGIVGWGPGSCF